MSSPHGCHGVLRKQEGTQRYYDVGEISKMNKGIDISINNGHTSSMKTAISIPDHLFEEVSKLAQKNKTSRSQIFRRAVEEYLERLRAQKLFEDLNSAYAQEETHSEKLLRKKSLDYYDSTFLGKDSDDDQAG